MEVRRKTDWDNKQRFDDCFWPGDYIERGILQDLAIRFPPMTYDFDRIWCRRSDGNTYQGLEEVFLQFKAVSDDVIQFLGLRPLSDKVDFINVERFNRDYFRKILKEYSANKLGEIIEDKDIIFAWCCPSRSFFRLRAVLSVSADCYDTHKNDNITFWHENTEVEILFKSNYYNQLDNYNLKASRAWETFKNEVYKMEDYAAQGAEIAAFESLDQLEGLRKIINDTREQKRRLIIERENGAKV